MKIIGGALSRVLCKDALIAISNSLKIVDTLNRIIHGNDSVSDKVICSIVIKYIPILKLEVEKLSGE